MRQTRDQRKVKSFWTLTDIMEVLGIPYKPARRLYQRCEEVEREEDGEFRLFDNRVRKATVLKVARIKNADIA